MARATDRDRRAWGWRPGEVTSTSAVLWGHADQPARRSSRWRRTRTFTQLVRRREVQAIPANDLTVQRRVDGLRPGTRYWYRFRGEAAVSDVGTFLTAPRPNDDATIRFAWTGDYDAARASNETEPFWNDFGVFASMEAEGNHFNIGLGDTIYSDSETERCCTTAG